MLCVVLVKNCSHCFVGGNCVYLSFFLSFGHFGFKFLFIFNLTWFTANMFKEMWLGDKSTRHEFNYISLALINCTIVCFSWTIYAILAGKGGLSISNVIINSSSFELRLLIPFYLGTNIIIIKYVWHSVYFST